MKDRPRRTTVTTPTAEIAVNAPKETVRAAMVDFGGITVAPGTLRYDTKFGPIGRIMDRLVISKQFGKAWSGNLAGLKYNVESGQTVGKGITLDSWGVGHVAA